MNWSSRRYLEVILRLIPRRNPSGMGDVAVATGRTEGDARRNYDAFVYCNRALPGIEPAGDVRGAEPELLGLPLVGAEQVTIRWGRYQEYVAMFVEGEKATSEMKHRLQETLSPGLKALLQSPPEGRALRVWWSCQTPELEDMPWELTAYGNQAKPGADVLFVRGLPPAEPPLLLPAPPRLRIALIHDPATTPSVFPPDTVGEASFEVVSLLGPPREALRQAAAEGFEVVHLVADGFVSLSYDGILYVHDEASPELSAGELAQILSGSRVTLLALTPAKREDPDFATIAGMQVPSVYRSFAYFATWRSLTQTVVASIGPMRTGDLQRFWGGFYRGLGHTLAIHSAVEAALEGGPLAPVAVFLRHPWHRLFSRTEVAPTSVTPPPQQLLAQLNVSVDTLNQVKAMTQRLGPLPPSMAEFLDRETTRQQRLRDELKPWQEQSESEESL